MSVAFHWSLPPRPQAVSEARQTVRERCHDLPPPVLDDALLLTSELVTNAVRHATGDIECFLWAGPEAIRVEVSDQSPDYPVPTVASPDALSGRGLQIVAALATRWGAAPDPSRSGKTVWFEISTGPD